MKIPITKNLSTVATDLVGYMDIQDELASEIAARLAVGVGGLVLNACVSKDGDKHKLMHVSIAEAPAGAVIMNEFKMPLLSRYIPDGFPKYVLIPMEREQRAMSNYGGQDFKTLASRGGLGPDEAVAIMEDRRWQHMNVIELVDAFRKYHWI